jgi:hypothetical protein
MPGEGVQGKKSAWVEAILAEYQAHRAEVLSEAQAQQQTLALGVTAVGIVIAGAFNVWDNKLLAAVAFLGAIPLLSLLILVQLVGRALGLMRVGVYLEGLEQALRQAYPSAPGATLVWERTLALPRIRRQRWWKPSYEWHDFGAIGLFILLACGSVALGGYRAYAGHEATATALLVSELMLLALIAAALIVELATVRARVREDRDARRAT